MPHAQSMPVHTNPCNLAHAYDQPMAPPGTSQPWALGEKRPLMVLQVDILGQSTEPNLTINIPSQHTSSAESAFAFFSASL